MKILVAFATAHGSSADIADQIGRMLSADGLEITIANVSKVVSVEEYDAVVLGSPVHSGAWLPEVTQFIERVADNMGSKPVYMWLSCIRIMERHGEEHVREFYINHPLQRKINVRETAIFAGKLDLNTVDWQERWTLAARYDGQTWPSGFNGDFRDWDKIRDWAAHVASELASVKAV
jgi:menaquinone-dependent protoporphyrinogen oxidase